MNTNEYTERNNQQIVEGPVGVKNSNHTELLPQAQIANPLTPSSKQIEVDCKQSIEAFFAGYCDPGGNAAFGSIVRVDSKVVYSNSGYCGDGPNMSPHLAAYCGALDALTQAVKHRGTISLQGNDRMVIMQLGPDVTFGDKRYKAKDGLYLPHYKKAIKLVNQHRDRMLFHWVPWQQNLQCNELAKSALSERHVKLGIESGVKGRPKPAWQGCDHEPWGGAFPNRHSRKNKNQKGRTSNLRRSHKRKVATDINQKGGK